jgi:hypothetical protein
MFVRFRDYEFSFYSSENRIAQHFSSLRGEQFLLPTIIRQSKKSCHYEKS